MPLDVLALAAHPDDVELCAGGTMCLLADQGYRTGIVDFTRGELGTRGTPEGRMKEAARAGEILGLAARENLGLPDGDIQNTKETQRALIRSIRRHRPRIVLITAEHVRHPDHGDATELAVDALFYSGLAKIETAEDDGTPQQAWRPHHVLHYLQALDVEPTFVVDVSSVWERRMRALLAFESQFYQPGGDDGNDGGDGPETYISNPRFLKWVEARARTYGYRIGADYGEPFVYRHGPVGVDDLVAVLDRERPFR
ncbi:bacillithiol biosynthesis deacetylase BshB1 [Rubrivirga sp. IMCC45206]|uniref:bacillithiol biosynthesis deacetylase BshB1 n=1 Tax=Rubrivirga sp. IMCC45206 TaxID=3391614 RepID=UPI00398FCD52